MKKVLIPLVVATILILAGAIAYHFLSPKVVVNNRSGVPIQQATLSLPASRVTFGTVEPGDTATIYYSPQKTSGTLDYSVQVNGIAHRGSLPYSDSGEYGRVIRIEVDTRGSVTAEVERF